MRLNTLKPALGAKKNKKRIGRGIGSGNGKTCGFGHKGQTSRSGYAQKIGFEGGQMPLQRRVPKFGFKSLTKMYTAEVRLNELNKINAEKIDLKVLKQANVVPSQTKRVRVILSGNIDKALTLSGLIVTCGAKKAIELLGGRVEA